MGYYDNDWWEGFGKFWNADLKEYFEGEWSGDKKSKGWLIKQNLEILDGTFRDDRKEGDQWSKVRMHPIEYSKILKPFLKHSSILKPEVKIFE